MWHMIHAPLFALFQKLTVFRRCHQARSRPLVARLRAHQVRPCHCPRSSLGADCLLLSRSGQALRPQCAPLRVCLALALQAPRAPLQVYRALALLVVLWSRSRLPVTVRSALRHPRPEDSPRSGGMHSPRWTPVLRHSGQLRA